MNGIVLAFHKEDSRGPAYGAPASAGGVSLMKPDVIFNRADPHQPLPAKAGTPYADAFLIMKYLS